MTIRIDHRQGSLQLTGQLDRWNVHLLQDTISALLLSDRDRWTADVTALAVVDHAGLRAIGTVYRRLLRNGRHLSLRGASPELGRALARLQLSVHLLDEPGQLRAASRPLAPSMSA